MLPPLQLPLFLLLLPLKILCVVVLRVCFITILDPPQHSLLDNLALSFHNSCIKTEHNDSRLKRIWHHYACSHN